ncbi:polyphosphate polymerase domain-containing protein [Acutalibacter caecimuris]|uniref:polyphosphate polymerase domain-containing protein n=1 Tax=Acutalibacter caecimuris TaxID=3093657 RepID=UPI002AC9066A|nr:polyphosphate polymerase domain-containing protein [Acutalibacter sp. M00118]
MKLRHEWKHTLGPGDLPALRARLSAVLQPDPHAVDGRYAIRSLYFDTPGDRALWEKINGVNRREKFRLRYYNGDTGFILLEKKVKQNGLCGKAQSRISHTTALALLEKRTACVQDALCQELCRKMATAGLGPKAIVDYTREAFLYPPGNVRVTLDYGLRVALHCNGFLDPNCLCIPVEAPTILEVKWDGFLPSLIRDLVQTPGVRTSAFSKYAACRIYG